MKKLKRVYVEITNVCNLACAFCPGTIRKPRYMTAEEFSIILGKLEGWTDHLYLHVMGEPLLHPQLSEFIAMSGRDGFMVNLTTNGVLISRSEAALLPLSALRQVNFSLHSQEDFSDRIALDKYLDDILSFTKRAQKESSMNITYRLWNTSYAFARTYNEYVAKKLEECFHPGFSIIDRIYQSKRLTIGDRVFLDCDEQFSWPSMDAEETGSSGFCMGLRNQAAILSDGTVVPCCLDSDGTMNLGNIFTDDLEHIIYGERGRAIYEGFSGRTAVEELCRRCGYRTRFS